MLVTIIAVWAVWPLACGILGASRGQAAQGALHGLLWGPFGLLIVLLGKRKYACPMCGHKTLTRPPETARPTTVIRPPPTHPSARPLSGPIANTRHPAAATISTGGYPPPPSTIPPAEADEAERLHAWLNADRDANQTVGPLS